MNARQAVFAAVNVAADGTVTFDFNFDGWQRLNQGIFGFVTSSVPGQRDFHFKIVDTNGVSTYDEVFAPIQTNPVTLQISAIAAQSPGFGGSFLLLPPKLLVPPKGKLVVYQASTIFTGDTVSLSAVLEY